MRMAEWKMLHAGWTLAVLMPGLENTPADHDRYREQMIAEANGVAPDAAEEEREAQRKAQAEVATRKVMQQWARLGFQQAKFGCDFWYLTPARLTLKSKEEVADLQITREPERQPLHEGDVPFAEYLRSGNCVNENGQTVPTFEADVRRFVAQGADLNRMHVLQRALMGGVRSDKELRLLVSLGADPNNTDEFGDTALHCTAELLGGSEPAQKAAVLAAQTLIALGASRAVVNVHGSNPLDAMLKKARFYNDFEGAFGLSRQRWNGRDDEKYRYGLMLVLLEPAQKDALLGGVLTPRQLKRMTYNAEVQGDYSRDLPTFENRVPRPSEDLDIEVPYWKYIPTEVRGEEVYKSFVGGWSQVMQAISEIISPRGGRHQPALPTVEAVTRELFQGRYRYDDRYSNFFFSRGGKIEFALDGLIDETIVSESFFFTYEEDIEEVYESLPEHPLDEQWGFVRYMFLGPKGKVQAGPFRSAY